jgi:toxin FitB
VVSFLLDTNAIAEIRRGRDSNVQAWAEAVSDHDLHLSVLTLGEIRKGIELQTRFAPRILPVDTRIAQESGRLNAATPRNTVDSLIAATALVHDLTVVTRNNFGLRLLRSPAAEALDLRESILK